MQDFFSHLLNALESSFPKGRNEIKKNQVKLIPWVFLADNLVQRSWKKITKTNTHTILAIPKYNRLYSLKGHLSMLLKRILRIVDAPNWQYCDYPISIMIAIMQVAKLVWTMEAAIWYWEGVGPTVGGTTLQKATRGPACAPVCLLPAPPPSAS